MFGEDLNVWIKIFSRGLAGMDGINGFTSREFPDGWIGGFLFHTLRFWAKGLGVFQNKYCRFPLRNSIFIIVLRVHVLVRQISQSNETGLRNSRHVLALVHGFGCVFVCDFARARLTGHYHP